MNSDEFYVGYNPTATPKISDFMRRFIISLGLVMLIISFTLIVNQKPFSTSNFEYGVSSSISGYVFTQPIPHMRQYLGKDINGNDQYNTVLLVGSGKAGANSILKKIEETLGTSWQGKLATLTGYLIYGDGKTLLQINEEDNMQLAPEPENNFVAKISSTSRRVKIAGEIIDPKCYFGVMKPGEGKPHRSCAIRCIAGGIPPVLKSTGNYDYFLLLGEDLQPINQNVLGLIGDHLNLEGELTEMDDWKILQVDTEELKHISEAKIQLKNFVAMNDGITICR